jgi:hypothetical protein
MCDFDNAGTRGGSRAHGAIRSWENRRSVVDLDRCRGSGSDGYGSTEPPRCACKIGALVPSEEYDL